jgi:hypothetical protein
MPLELFENALAALKILTLPMVGLRFLPCHCFFKKSNRHKIFSSEGYIYLRKRLWANQTQTCVGSNPNCTNSERTNTDTEGAPVCTMWVATSR